MTFFPFKKITAVFSFILLTTVGSLTGQIPQLPTDTLQTGPKELPVNNSFFSVSDNDFITLNTEETVDGFHKIPGFGILDLGEIGQFSGVSYRGTAHGNTVPLLNGIPLEPGTFGSLNWLNIPYYAIESVKFDDAASIIYPGVAKAVVIETKKEIAGEPFSRVNYRIGDLDWKHVDVTLSRKLTSNLAFYGAGSSENYTGSYLGLYQSKFHRYHGSNMWFDFIYDRNSLRYRWSFLAVDKDNPELNEIPIVPAAGIKSLPHSRNIKMAAITLSKADPLSAFRTHFYFWQMRDKAPGNVLYDHGEFYNIEKVFGLQIHGRVVKKETFTLDINQHYKISNTKGTYWRRDKPDNFLKSSIVATKHVGKKVTFTGAPELDLTLINQESDIHLLGRLFLDYKSSNSVNHSVSLSHSKRPVLQQFLPGSIVYPAGKEPLATDTEESRLYELISEISLKSGYTFQRFHLIVNPFFIQIKNPVLFRTDVNLNVNPGAKPGRIIRFYGSNHSYGGASIGLQWKFGRYGSIRGNYTYLSGEKSKLYDARHSLFAQVTLQYLEDFFLKRNLDTVIYLSAIVKSGRNALNYFPLYQQFATTGTEVPLVAALKARGSVKINTVTLFYEIDLLSRSEFQYALGYPMKNRMLRMGLEWNFRN
ncbi:hypothetical protein ACFL5L_03255 [candidate division KSB1 bacterium]